MKWTRRIQQMLLAIGIASVGCNVDLERLLSVSGNPAASDTIANDQDFRTPADSGLETDEGLTTDGFDDEGAMDGAADPADGSSDTEGPIADEPVEPMDEAPIDDGGIDIPTLPEVPSIPGIVIPEIPPVPEVPQPSEP